MTTPLIGDDPAAQFERDGYYVARGLFSREDIAAIRETFMEQAKDGPVPGMSDWNPDRFLAGDPLAFYPRMMHPAQHPDLAVGPLSKRLMLDHRLYGYLLSFMQDEPIAVQSMFYFKPPGARGQAMHQDNFYLRVKPGTCMAAWIAVDDCDEANGGMMVIPGTHAMEVLCPTTADSTKYFTNDHVEIPGLEPEMLDMTAGDVLFFNGSLVHGSSPNSTTDRFRRSLIFHYAPESSEELSRYYDHPIRFDGTPVTFADATGGGPCGTVVDAQLAVH
jgi:phytanoyl-CoA hydroxylase